MNLKYIHYVSINIYTHVYTKTRASDDKKNLGWIPHVQQVTNYDLSAQNNPRPVFKILTGIPISHIGMPGFKF